MENNPSKPSSSTRVDGSGAAASAGSIAAGKDGVAAGRDATINKITNNYKITQVRGYLKNKGPSVYRGLGNPDQAWDLDLNGEIAVSDLREILLNDPVQREKLKQKPRMVSVKGLLYPSALLASGWWESRMQKNEGIIWRNGIQEWLFGGFHSWGPSWDFAWDFEHPENEGSELASVAQLGDGDEANSIPVIIPADKKRALSEKFQERGHQTQLGVSGVMATVNGVLCHRSHCPEAERLGLVGGILDFCIWLKPGEDKHKISPDRSKPDIYSAYLWKCLAPSAWIKDGGALDLNQVYFVWEHTNLADGDSVKYNLDALEHKQNYIRKIHDNSELVLLQKSSILVPGEPEWSKQEFYAFFQQKDDDI